MFGDGEGECKKEARGESPRIVEMDGEGAGEAHECGPAVEAEKEARGEVASMGHPVEKAVNEGPEPLPPPMSDDDSSKEMEGGRELGAGDDDGGRGAGGAGGAGGVDAGHEVAGRAAGGDVGGEGEDPKEMHILSEHAKWRLQTNTDIGAPASAPSTTPLSATPSVPASATAQGPAAAATHRVRNCGTRVGEEEDDGGEAVEPKINHQVKAVMCVHVCVCVCAHAGACVCVCVRARALVHCSAQACAAVAQCAKAMPAADTVHMPAHTHTRSGCNARLWRGNVAKSLSTCARPRTTLVCANQFSPT